MKFEVGQMVALKSLGQLLEDETWNKEGLSIVGYDTAVSKGLVNSIEDGQGNVLLLAEETKYMGQSGVLVAVSEDELVYDKNNCILYASPERKLAIKFLDDRVIRLLPEYLVTYGCGSENDYVAFLEGYNDLASQHIDNLEKELIELKAKFNTLQATLIKNK